ncbi:S24 family peptidase [uncultured Cohaesibacter sp.]|uniref:S24 family peptidase n=1 Tax=uncultured Cohaesibacter sp. TaxID=1002546 RepID=UPI0029C7FE31|nr:S24 family peptidase [uncultured Cohaesibacter sp.]
MNSEIENGFRARLVELVEKSNMEPFAWAKAVGIPGATFNRIWNEGSIPKSEHLIRISEYSNISIDWLLTGKGVSEQTPNEFIGIPRYDASLSAGNGFWNIEKANVLDHIPFTAEFLRRRLGRSNPDDLIILTANGDSMEPLIGDGDLVMVDQKKNELTDGIFAFVLNGMARVKRLNQTLSGDLEVMSENALYRTEILKKEDLANFQLVGKVVWCGHHFAR